MIPRPAGPLALGLACLLATTGIGAPLRLDLRRHGKPWSPPTSIPACPTSTPIPFLWIEPPLEQASWIFHTVMGPLDAYERAREGLTGPVTDPLLPPGIVLDAVLHHDPCLGNPTFPPRLNLRLRDSLEVFDTLSAPVPSYFVPDLLNEARERARPPQTWTDKGFLHLKLRQVGSTPPLVWLERIWCEAGCGGWRDAESCPGLVGHSSQSCEHLAYRHPQALWLPGEEHVLHLDLTFHTGERDTLPVAPIPLRLDLDARALQRDAP